MCDTTLKLTAAMARGEEPAIAEFYRRFFDALYAAARHVSRRDESFCLDVVQETLLRVVRTIRPVATEAQLVAWLRLIVKSVCYDLLRREQRRRRRESAAVQGARAAGERNTAGNDGAAAEASANEDRLAWLRRELLAVDPEMVRLIELRYVEGWTLARIAAACGLGTGAVDGRIRRALARLRGRAAGVSSGGVP